MFLWIALAFVLQIRIPSYQRSSHSSLPLILTEMMWKLLGNMWKVRRGFFSYAVVYYGVYGQVKRALDLRSIKRSGVRFPLLIMCRSVGQTSHSILFSIPSSDGYLVHENCVWLAQAACILVRSVRCFLPGEMILLNWCVCPPGKIMVSRIWYRCHTLNFVPISLLLFIHSFSYVKKVPLTLPSS